MRIFDLHNDVLTARPKKIGKCLKGGAVLAVWTTKLTDPYRYFDKARQLTDNWAIEDMGFCQNIDIFNLRPLYVSLTWNDENAYAGGALSQVGLKTNGIQAIKRLEQLNIALDVAHLNRKSFFQTIQIAKKPLICSHCCFDGVFSHKRNLTDEQVDLIIKTGGVIGLTFVSEFMGVIKASVKDIIKQVEYFCSRFPPKNLAIGSDFFGTDNPAIKNYNGFKHLKNQLLRLNYTKTQIDKIFYQNAFDFFSEEQNGQQNHP